MKAGLRTLFSSQLLLELLDLHFSLAIVKHEVIKRENKTAIQSIAFVLFEVQTL